VDVAAWLEKAFQFLQGAPDAKGGEGGVALLLAQLEAPSSPPSPSPSP